MNVYATNGWPTECFRMGDFHERKGPWQEKLTIQARHFIWSIELPGIDKTHITVEQVASRIIVSAPWKDTRESTFLDVPEGELTKAMYGGFNCTLEKGILQIVCTRHVSYRTFTVYDGTESDVDSD